MWQGCQEAQHLSTGCFRSEAAADRDVSDRARRREARALSFCLFADFKCKNPGLMETGVSGVGCLAMTYSHMGRPHTTIGDDAFHC